VPVDTPDTDAVATRGSGSCQPLGCTGSRRRATVPGPMWYRLDLRVRADVDDEVLHEIALLANTYAVVDEVQASRDPESGDARFMARIDAPSPHAALGALLTVIAQTSGHAGLADQGALHRVVIEREEAVHHTSG
jgi:hypothetical protein